MLLDVFDPEMVAAIEAEQAAELVAKGSARAQRTRTRQQLRRAKSEQALAEVLPRLVEPGETWDVISNGDVDSLSYLAHFLEGYGWFDRALVSTWCVARPDLDAMGDWLNQGRIGSLHLYLGEIFAGQYVGEYERAKELQRDYGMRLTVARNHSKVMLLTNDAEDVHLAIRSSANLNTNPRIEQTTVTNDRALVDFYREFFHGIRSIERNQS